MQSDHDLPEHNTRNFIWIIVGLTVVAFGCIACCGAGAWLAVDRIGDIPGLGDFADAELPPSVVESAAEKQAWLKAAFADPPPDGGFDRRSLDVFFQRLVDASQAEDGSAFQRLVDGDRFWRSIKERGLIKELSRGDDRSLPAEYLADLESPGTFERHYLQAVTPADRPDEAVAYVILWEAGTFSEYRWWLVRDGRLWKAYDWEPLQGGIRQSLRHAAYVAGIPRLASYDSFWVTLERVYADQQEGKLFEATQKLREASRLSVPQIFDAEHKMQAAYAFAQLSRPLPELEIYEQATAEQRSAAPGLLLGWAMQAYADDEFDLALDLVGKYEREIGGGPNVEKIRAESLVALGRLSEAAPHYLRLLKYSPDDPFLQSQAARYLPSEQLAVLAELLRKHPEPAQATYRAATYSTGEPAVLRIYESLLTELSAEAPKLDIVRGMRLQAEGEIDAAADAFLAAYQKSKQAETPDSGGSESPSDEESGASEPDASDVEGTSLADDALAYFHELYWEADRPLEAYDRSPDKQATFEYLDYQADEYGMSVERRRELVDRHSTTAPNDPLLLAHRAQTVADEGKHAEAADLWARVIEAEEGYEYYRSSLAAELVKLGRLDEAVELARTNPDDVSLIAPVSEGLQQANRYDDLLELVELPRPDDLQNNQAVALAKTEALAGLGRFDEAEAVLKSQLERSEEDWQRSGNCRAWLELAEKAKWPVIRYLDLAGRDSMPVLMGVCQESDGKQLEQLLADWQARGGSPEAVLPAQVELLARRNDFEAIVSYVMEHGGVTALASSSNSEPLLHYVRSLLHSNHVERALDAARAYYDATGNALQLIVAHMLHSDWEAAEKTAAATPDYTRHSLYFDEVALPLLRSDAAAGFRQRFPRDGDSLARTLAVVLLPEPLPGTRQEQLERLRKAAGDLAEDAVAEHFESTEGTQLILHDGDRGDWLIAWGSDAYAAAGDAAYIESDDLRELVTPQRGWIAFDWAGGRSSDADTAWRDLGSILNTLAPSHASLLVLQTSRGRFLCPFSPQLLEQMQTAGFASTDIADREICYLYRQSDPLPTTSVSRTFPDFAAAYAARQAGDIFTVDTTLSLPHGRLPVTVAVERIILRPYSLEIVANADGLPKPLQRLFPGHRLQLDGWSLTGWTYTKGDKTIRSEDVLGGSEPREASAATALGL